MTTEKTINYIPAREYTPGTNKKYHSVFLKDIQGQREMFYLRIEDAEALVAGHTPRNLTLYRQLRVIRRGDEPGIIGVHTEPTRDLNGILGKLKEELEKQRMGGRR